MPKRPVLFRNLGTKLLALTIALVVWFVFSAQRRERISERSYRIPLSVVNVPRQTLIATPLPSTVEVRLRGPFTALRQLEPEKLEAVIDLLDAPRGEKIYRMAPEDINVPQEVEVIAISPPEVRLVLDATAEKTVPVAVRVAGEPAAGYAIEELQAEPRLARVVGPASALAQTRAVATEPVSVAERDATFSTSANVLADAPGVRVREGQLVTVTVRIGPIAKSTPAPRPPGRRPRR
ncbi:MAG TPA: CdaR family protein [Thermoanaerobaculia bacterium]|nr:CdaR family protein [Thermoanaerobaculia bacterium]